MIFVAGSYEKEKGKSGSVL